MAWYADSAIVGDQEYIYYGGYSAGHKTGDREVGLARLRKNGFVSFDAGRAGGFLRTVTAALPGDSLTVNAVVRGELRVRLLDAQGKLVPRFDWADCVPVRGDSVAHPIEWHDNQRLPGNRPVHLDFLLGDADLYGFDIPERSKP